MRKYFAFVVFFAAVSGVLSGYINPQAPQQECSYDEDCPATNSYCKQQQVCECRTGYEYYPDNEMCFPTALGLRCTEVFECTFLKNAMCIDGKCKCRRDMIESQDGKACLPMSRLYGSCREDQQCVQHTPHSHCNVTSGLCDCDNNFHAAQGPPECVMNSGLGSICNATRECYIDEELAAALQCATKDGSSFKKCQCVDGYYEEGARCTKDSSSHVVVSITALGVVLVAAVIR